MSTQLTTPQHAFRQKITRTLIAIAIATTSGIASADYVPVAVDDINIMVPVRPNLPLFAAGNPTDAMSVFIKNVEMVDAAGSGFPYFLVVEVDPAKIKDYTVKSSDPYWLKYYCGMWKNGTFASAYAPNDPNPRGPQPYKRGPGYWPATYFNSPTAFTHDTYANILPYDWVANGSPAISSILPPNYEPPHFRKNIIIPNTSRYYIPYGIEYGSGNDRIGLYAYTTRAYTIYMMMRILTGSETVVAGEVTASGWGMVPLSATDMLTPDNRFYIPYSPWVIVKPYDKDIAFTQQTGKAWVKITNGQGIKPIQWQGTTATTPTAAWDAMMVNYLGMDAKGQMTGSSASFGSDLTISSVGANPSFGGVLKPDMDRSGDFIIATGVRDPSTGQVATHAQSATPQHGVSVANQYGYVFTNGSGVSIADATKTAGAISESRGGIPVVLIYAAQRQSEFLYADESKYRNSMIYLRDNVSPTANIKTIHHSWTGHTGLNVFKNDSRFQIHLWGPAEGNLSEAGKEGYLNDLRNATTTVILVHGENDSVTILGGGTDQAALDAANSNPNHNVLRFQLWNSGHSAADMIMNGATNLLDDGDF